jgi:hypothetical protein
MASASRQALNRRVGEHDEVEREGVDIETFVIQEQWLHSPYIGPGEPMLL